MLQSDLAQWLVAPANAITEVMEHVKAQEGYAAKGESGEGLLEGIEWALVTEPI